MIFPGPEPDGGVDAADVESGVAVRVGPAAGVPVKVGVPLGLGDGLDVPLKVRDGVGEELSEGVTL